MSKILNDADRDLLTRLVMTNISPTTLRGIDRVLSELGKEHSLSILQIAAIGAAAGLVSGLANTMQAEADEEATGGNLTSLDL